MSVVFDLLGVQNRDHGERGIARYVLQLALAIERQAPGLVDTYLCRPHLPVPGVLEPLIGTGRVTMLGRDRSALDTTAGGVFLAGSLFELQEPFDSVLPPAFRGPGWHRMAVLYDLIPSRFPHLYLSNPQVRHPYNARLQAARTMDRLLAISQATADDAQELLGVGAGRFTVIGAGADARFSPHPLGRDAAVASMDSAPPVPGIRAGYVLFPSGIEPRKNVDRLLAAYATLPPEVRHEHQLVLVCKVTVDEAAHLQRTAEGLGIVDDLVVTGYVGDDDLVRLYRAAHLVVFPSLYEGFGLPILEAMQCGAAVICSDSSSLREVQTDATARFDPEDVGAIATAIRRVLGDPAELGRLRRQDPPPFGWDEAAALTIEHLRTASTVQALKPGRRPRVALLSPLPPQRSGIATYAARMVEHLRDRVDLTVFVETDDITAIEPIEGVEIHPAVAFDAVDGSGRYFDRILHFLGNSSFHVETLELIRRHGGTVLAHDARLTGLYSEVQKSRPHRLVEHSVGATVRELYPHRYREAVVAFDVIPPDLAAQAGVFLLRELVDRADRVLVHSDYAATLTELDTGTRPEVVFPIPCVPPHGAGPTPDTAVIVSLGIVSPVKRPDVLIEALARVREEVPGATVRFVGGTDDAQRQSLETMAAAVGVSDAVSITGHVDDDAFAEHLAAAACAVQLRAFTNGESSAAVMDALSAGVPCVVTGLGAMRELPEDAVVTVPADVDAAGLAAALVPVLQDHERRAAMRAAAHDHAREHSFADAAQRLLEALGLDEVLDA